MAADIARSDDAKPTLIISRSQPRMADRVPPGSRRLPLQERLAIFAIG
jgi:hypothetical protein